MEPQKTNPESEVKQVIVENMTPVKHTSGNTMMIYIAVAVFLGIALVTTIGGIIFVLLTKNNNTQKTDNVVATVTSTTMPTATTMVAESVDAIYYVKDKSIYKYDISTATSTVLYTVKSDEFLMEIYQINSNKIGFAYSGDSLITIAILNISTKTATVLKTTTQPSIQLLLWYRENQFSYVEATTDDLDKFIYVNGSAVFEKDFAGVNPRRGVSYTGDSMRAEVSPDNNRSIYQPPIVTSIGSSTFLDMFVFDKRDNSMETIANSKMGSWISANEVLYEDKTLGKLYVYNVDTNAKTEYTDFALSVSRIYGLHKMGDNLVYWRPGTIYKYNLVSKTESVVLSNATEVIWLDETNIVYRPLPNCPAFDETSGSCLQPVKIHNLLSGAPDVLISNGVLTHTNINNKGYYNCESSECAN